MLSFLGMIFISELFAAESKSIQNNIKSGNYVVKNNITIGDLRRLPVPKSNEDYAFLQCIDTSCNIVIGSFSRGDRIVTLIKDRNADGKVDSVVSWNFETKKPKFFSNPQKKYSVEKFKQMKLDILNGEKKNGLSVNIEGAKYLNSLLDSDANKEIIKYKSGYRVSLLDPDSSKKEMLIYLISYDVYGASLSYEIVYRRKGNIQDSPVINFSVFCLKSKDKLIIDQTKKMIKKVAKHTFK